MTYAKHIGRVGALAVALGVGMAVATTPGIAWAAPDSGSASTDTADAEPEGAAPDGAAPVADSPETAAPTAGVDKRNEAGDEAGTGSASGSSPSATVIDTGSGVVVSSSGGEHSSTKGSGNPKATKSPKPAKKPVSPAATPKPAARLAAQSNNENNSGQAMAVKTATAQSISATMSVSPPTAAVATVAPVAAVAQVMRAATAVVTTPVSVAAKVVDAVTAALFGAGSGGSVDSPASWVLAAAARRQFDPSLAAREETAAPLLTSQSVDTLADAPPTAVLGDPDSVTGAVSGQIVASNPTGKNAYTLAASPGEGTVVINKKTGQFTYTPTAAQRVSAELTAGEQTQQFSIAVSDGNHANDTTVDVTVTISPTPIASVGQVSTGHSPHAVAATNTHAYVTNSDDGTVTVIDTLTRTVVKTITVGVNPTEIVVKPDGTRVYVANGGSSTVSVIDTATNTVIKEIPVALPGAMAISPNGKTLYVSSFQSASNRADLTKINTATNRVTGTVRNGAAAQIAATPDGTKIYLANNLSLAELKKWSTTPKRAVIVVPFAQALAISPVGNRLYVVNQGSIMELDTKTNEYLGSFGFGDYDYVNSPFGAVVNRDGSLLMLAGLDGSVAVYDTASQTLLTTVTTDPAADNLWPHPSIAMSPDGMELYMTDSATNTLQILSMVPPNVRPTAGPATVGTPNASTGAAVVNTHADDGDDDALAYTASKPAKGTVVVNADGTVTYTPTAAARHAASAVGAKDEDKTDTFTITVDDGRRGVVAVPVTVNILPADIAPTAKYSAGSPTSWTGGVVKGRVKGTDKDKDRLTYITSGSTAKGGTVILDAATGRFSYTPTPAARQAAATGDPAAKTDTFTVTVDDGHGGHIPVTVTVKISPASH